MYLIIKNQNPCFYTMPENQNTYGKDGKKVRNDIFNSLGHTINSSCFYELQTCCRPNKVQEKTFILPKNFPEIAVFTRRDCKFINAMTITRRNQQCCVSYKSIRVKHRNC